MALGIFKKLAKGLTRTREGLIATLQGVAPGAPIDEEAFDDLEASLLAADLGLELTDEVMTSVRNSSKTGGLGTEGLSGAVRRALLEAFSSDSPAVPRNPAGPHVVFVVGVNGGGKTTTVGKLAAKEAAKGHKSLIVAADTFRAAAIDQLETWATRAGVDIIKHREGSDPSAVLFDALKAAVSREIDTVFVDTAGRLHTQVNLMAELSKLVRIADREVPGAPHEVLLVLDATTGQNGLVQAKEFTTAAELTGVVLTKLDGTAKGGVALGIHRALGVPIRYVGVGESLDDLLEFEVSEFVDGLLGETH